MEASAQRALAIQEYKEELERQIRSTVREYEREHGGPLAAEMSFADNTPGGMAPDGLKSRLGTAVAAFHGRAEVDSSGIRVKKVTVIDSDADGTFAIDVEYEYPGYV